MKMNPYSLLQIVSFIAVFLVVISQKHTSEHECTQKDLHKLEKALQNFSKCSVKEWNADVANVAAKLQDVLKSLNQVHAKTCEKFEPLKCEIPIAPKNGGLICATSNGIRYCKPMCNEGYDFSFLRRSRLYEKCGPEEQYNWTTQYIGGNRLAECIESSIAVSGTISNYFPAGQDCHSIQYNYNSERQLFNTFLKEIQVPENAPADDLCLMCEN